MSVGNEEQRGGGLGDSENGEVVVLDISAEHCPMTWVRTRVALESCAPGSLLHVLLGPGEMLKNIPRNAEEDGHQIVSLEPEAGERHRLVIRRKRA